VSCSKNLLFIGDSFVKRLKDYHSQRFHGGNFLVRGSPVGMCVCGLSGAGPTLVDTQTGQRE